MFARMFGQSQLVSATSLDQDPALDPPKDLPTPDERRRKAAQRVSFGPRDAVAYAWPSEGGLLTRPVDAVDLEHLRVSRLEPTQRSDPFDQAAEDAWADTLRQVAPTWVRSRDDLLSLRIGARPKTSIEATSVYTAWPSNGHGVWLLAFPDGREKDGFAVYSLCTTGDERCRVLERFGGKFFENSEQVFELSKAYSDECRRQRDELGWDDEPGACG